MFYAIYYPVESHIDCFAPLLLDGVVGYPSGTKIVGDDWSRWLRVAEVNESSADGGGFAGVEEECSEFRFAGRRHYVFEYGTQNVYGSITGRKRRIGGRRRVGV